MERSLVEQNVTKREERRKEFTTDSGLLLERVFLPAERDYASALGMPGEFPFTRGPYPTMYRGRLWTMRQYAGFGTAEESNRRYRYLLDNGTTGLSVAFDLPTQMGYDSDHRLAEGEVGRVGVAIDTLADMEVLFEAIPLEKVTTSMTINATAAILLCMYVALAKRQGADLRKISGTVQNDILKEYISRGTHIFPPGPSMRLVTDLFRWCSSELPRWNTISISGYHIREAGSTAAQELGFTLANGIAYVQAALEAGLDVDAFGSQLSFFFNAHNNFLEEIAKFRAARRLWARIMKERFSAKSAETMRLRFHAQTGGSTLTAQQIDNNVVRVTLQALAAVLGGCQSLHTNSRDEALALPTEESATLALRTQQIIAHESGVTDTADPLGGAYALETLTDELEEAAEKIIAKIDALGGAVAAIEQKFYQSEITQSAYKYQRAIEEEAKTIVGVNAFLSTDGAQGELLRIDESVSTRQIENLRRVRAERRTDLVQASLTRVRECAQGTDNLLVPILEAVEAYASVGEISDALRTVWGEYAE
ncbi:MAG TPA: methylmalonyl-CoA mutase family protein [Bacteroidota bacterium]|nr:methylmalonyl-CoA mutase family protein [Bacteroidota bacterium]